MDAKERASLAQAFEALGSGRRLDLLDALRTPRILAEIELADDESGANIARQSVSRHLQRLLDAGLVARRDVVREGRETMEFIVNHQSVFMLAESVRALARLRPPIDPAAQTAPSFAAERNQAHRPCLVAVRALEEGTTYRLQPSHDRIRWTIGRRREADVPLDFDPAVSASHAHVAWEAGSHWIEDAGSRNGTYVNFRALVPGGRHALAHGDVVGVGNCLLVYWGP